MNRDFSKTHITQHAIDRFKLRNEAARHDSNEEATAFLSDLLKQSKPTEPLKKLKILDRIRKADSYESKKVEYRRCYNWVMVVINDVMVTIHKNEPGTDWK